MRSVCPEGVIVIVFMDTWPLGHTNRINDASPLNCVQQYPKCASS